jgi:Na+/glutamate symporter
MSLLPFWQRLLITVAAMLVASWIIGLMWQSLFRFPLPSYVGGAVGGRVALPIWEQLKRIRGKDY